MRCYHPYPSRMSALKNEIVGISHSGVSKSALKKKWLCRRTKKTGVTKSISPRRLQKRGSHLGVSPFSHATGPIGRSVPYRRRSSGLVVNCLEQLSL